MEFHPKLFNEVVRGVHRCYGSAADGFETAFSCRTRNPSFSMSCHGKERNTLSWHCGFLGVGTMALGQAQSA